MKDERNQEVAQARENFQRRQKDEIKKRKEIESIKDDLFGLFGEDDPYKRGKALEGVLNRFFAAYDISIREAFTLRVDGLGIVEQIDGVIQLDGNVYLVEMKWEKDPLGKSKVSEHLVRVFNRGHSRGILISASGYTGPAVLVCEESLHQAPFCLCLLEEFVFLLDGESDCKDMLRSKVQAALIDKNPFLKILPGKPKK